MEPKMGMHTLKDLYIRELEYLFNAERQIKEALPRIAKDALAPELQYIFDRHVQHTERHIKRLEKIFQKLQKAPVERECLGMSSLIAEYDELMSEDISTIIKDWALIEAVKKMEHYDISVYRNVRSYARLLGDTEAVSIFTRSIEEKYHLEDRLSRVADEQARLLGHIYWAPWRSGWGVFIGRPAG
jgi:ferritin-like metal-binding protein YciE